MIFLEIDFAENVPKFPRMRVWDPYKRLGVSLDASEEEIRGARNFLLEQYAGHEQSVESVEAAYEKILMKSFRERKKSKINLKSKLKKKVEESPTWVKTLLSFVELPPIDVILRRLFLFVFMGVWSVLNSAETGPAFQVYPCEALILILVLVFALLFGLILGLNFVMTNERKVLCLKSGFQDVCYRLSSVISSICRME